MNPDATPYGTQVPNERPGPPPPPTPLVPPPEPVVPEPALPAFPRMPWRPPRTPVEDRMPRWARVLVPIILFFAAFAFYQYHIEDPNIVVFDEAHYIKVARNYSRGLWIDPGWGDPRPYNFEHPPLGKYLIATGIWLSGKPHDDWENQAYITQLCGHDNPECAKDAKGWRFSSTVVGASGIVAIYFVGLRLFNRVSCGAFAAIFLGLDGMYYMHARLAMLEIFPTAFSLWALAFLFSPRRRGKWLAPIFLGLAIGSKYYALYFVPIFVLVAFLRARPFVPREPEPLPLDPPPSNRDHYRHNLQAAWHTAAPWLTRIGWAVLLGVIIPFLSLLAVYGHYLYLWAKMQGIGFAFREWLFVQAALFEWDFAGKTDHPFKSPPISWIPMVRPVWYYVFNYSDGRVGEMYSIGNPFLWWTATAAAVYVPLSIVIRFVQTGARTYLRWDFLERLAMYPFWFTRDLALLIAALLFWAAYLPWFLVQRIVFIFYMTFVLPTFSILAAGLVGEQWDRNEFPRVLAILYVVLAMAAFGIFYPVVSGIPVEKAHFNWIMNLIPWMQYSAP